MKNIWPLLGAALGLFIWMGGCEGTKPASPYRVMSLNVSIPPTNELHSSLLGAGSNELLYKVEGLGMASMSATLGPFATASSSGAIDFSVDIPGGGIRLLSLQLNDGGTHQPLAIGAAQIDFSTASPVTDLVVEMGSVTRTCYYTYGTSFTGAYVFSTDSIPTSVTGTEDIAYNTPAGNGGPATLYDPAATPGNIIAYLGNGNFLDFDYVPPDSSFNTTTAVAKLTGPITVGDIFCVKLKSIPGAHAWIQITNVGSGIGYTGPYFRFRLNSTVPYFAYERTAPDIAGTCSTTW